MDTTEIVKEIIIFSFLFFLGTAFILWGARIAKIENRTWPKAVNAALLCLLVNFFFRELAREAAPGALLVMIIVIYLETFIIKAVFNTDFKKAFRVWLFYFVCVLVTAIVILLGPVIFHAYLPAS